MTEPTEILTNPTVQYGFAGMCAALLGIIVWLIQKLLDVIDKNNNVIAEHTKLLSSFSKTLTDTIDLQVELKDKLNTRPCIRGDK